MSTVPNPMSGGVDVDAIIRAAALAAHPVGSYYWSSSSTNPGTLFGGTWTQITGRFVLAAGGGYNVGATGGAATHSHGTGSMWAAIQFGSYWSSYRYKTTSSWTPNYKVGGNVDAGSDSAAKADGAVIYGTTDASSTMPPYIVAYCWRRTA